MALNAVLTAPSEVVNQLLTAVATGDCSTLDRLVAPNYTAQDDAHGTAIHGRAGFATMVQRYQRAFPCLRLTIDDQTVFDDLVMTHWRLSYPNIGKRAGVATGPATLEFRGRRRSRIADGLVATEQIHWETLDRFGTALSGPQPRVGVEPVGRDGIDAAGAVLARAFADDPMFRYVLPESGDRARFLSRYGVALARFGRLFGAAHTTSDGQGVAVWAVPGAAMSPVEAMASGLVEVTAQLPLEARARLATMTHEFATVRERLAPEPHWYLMLVGVDPGSQGRGLGSTLLAPVLRRADADGRPCYLETAEERNLEFYRRQGFAVQAEIDLPDGGPHIWMMRRPA